MTIRLALYAGLLIILALLGYGLVLWGLSACSPPPLPGDELWSFRRAAADALALVLRLGSESCFTSNAGGGFALWLGARIVGVLLVALALMVLWELVGRELRRMWFRTLGGHVVIAGDGRNMLPLARAEGRFGTTVFLAPDRAEATDVARSRPFSEITTLAHKAMGAVLQKLGASRARLVAAATSSDLTNVAIADLVLASPGTGELLLRLEQPAVRALSAHRLSVAAEAAGRPFTFVSLTELQTRRGLMASMPGRYTLDGDPRIHVAFCGTGPGLEAAVMEIARQGLGLEHQRPLFSILRTGMSDFSAGVLERLMTSDAVEVRVTTAYADAGGFDTAAIGIITDAPPLRAIHCIGADPAAAEAMALRWEELLPSLRQPRPPIVAYTEPGRELGRSGMIRIAATADLAEAHTLARLREERARAVHAKYLELQRAARGSLFGTAPAEVDWKDLPALYRDENRAVSDQMEDVKLTRAFMLARPGADGAVLTAGETEDLAQMAHARWLAARMLAGWTHGQTRSDRLRQHPDLVHYAALNDAAKQKDRDEVASMVTMSGLAGFVLKRERRIAVADPLEGSALARLQINLAALPKDEVPVLVLAFNDEAMVPFAEAMLNDRVAVEAVVGSAGVTRPQLAPILRRAWRIHIALDRSAQAALGDRASTILTSAGDIHALA